MKARLGVAIATALLAFSSAPAASAGTRIVPQVVRCPGAQGENEAGRIFRDHPAYVRSYSPAYFARPYYYAPYPYSVPVPFFLGFGYLPYY